MEDHQDHHDAQVASDYLEPQDPQDPQGPQDPHPLVTICCPYAFPKNKGGSSDVSVIRGMDFFLKNLNWGEGSKKKYIENLKSA